MYPPWTSISVLSALAKLIYHLGMVTMHAANEGNEGTDGKDAKQPKYRRLYATLRNDIQTGRWALGERLPSEAQLVRSFGASRITVGRAVRDLQAAGLVERRAGSGTYVKRAHAAGGCSFGLLTPNREETGIFEPIWEGMMASPPPRRHALPWGSAGAHRP